MGTARGKLNLRPECARVVATAQIYDMLIEFTEIRRVIEPQAAMYAALRGNDAAIANIERGVRRAEAPRVGKMIRYNPILLSCCNNGGEEIDFLSSSGFDAHGVADQYPLH